MADQTYVVRREYARKLWVPYSGLRWPPPRLTQIFWHLHCLVAGHDWLPWKIDDVDGPGEDVRDEDDNYLGFMPYCSRDSEPGEFGTRSCKSGCGAVEMRWPRDQAPSKFEGRTVIELGDEL